MSKRPATRALMLGTAGHIDHGKTVLVEALTGVNTDRLPQERERGISIELGFASLALPSGRRLGVVDVPGHERFVRTMVAGASGIDLFVLVVAADDGVMPQTREHLAVLELLRVPSGVVALTKSDLVGAEGVEIAADDVREALRGGPYEQTAVVPVCAPSGAGLDELRAALDEVAARVAPARGAPSGDPTARLHVDRAFTIKGAGTIVTGTLWGKTVAAGERMRIEPSGREARVRSVEVHGHSREQAQPGERVALNLAGVERGDVERGDVLVGDAGDEATASTHVIDAAVEVLPGAGTLRRGTRVQLHHGTRETPARVAPIESDLLRPGAPAYAQLRLERPIVAAAGDRFVLRRIAPPETIGGGVVLDPQARKHGAGAAHAQRLRLLERGDPLERLEAELVAARSGLPEREIDGALAERLRSAERAYAVGSADRVWFTPACLERARASLVATLERLGADRPAGRGALARAAGLSREATAALLEELVSGGKALARGPGFQPAAASERDERAARAALELLERDGLEPRGEEALANALGLEREAARELLEALVLDGRAVRLRPGLFLHPAALAAAVRRVEAICRRDGSVTIATLRDDLGSSRKYAQALLEHLDGTGLTLRRGDRHVLRGRSQAAAVTPRAPV